MPDFDLQAALHDYVHEMTPVRAPAYADVRRQARRRRQLRRGGVLAGAALIVGLGTSLALGIGSEAPTARPGGGAAAVARPSVPTRGAVPDGAAVDCARVSFPAQLKRQQFAFAGRVTRIGSAGQSLLVPITFQMSTWYRGGTSPTITVRMQPPYSYRGAHEMSYRVGTVLLVAGAFDDTVGSRRLVAYGCGFTRYYTAADARQWQTILRG